MSSRLLAAAQHTVRAESMPEQPIIAFATAAQFRQWLTRHHADHPGIWLKIAKKASGIPTVTYAEALDEALCLGWIDGQKKTFDETAFLQKFTKRGKQSVWSKINVGHVARLEKEGRMKPAGLAAVDASRGRVVGTAPAIGWGGDGRVGRVFADEGGDQPFHPFGDAFGPTVGRGFTDAGNAFIRVDDYDRAVGFDGAVAGSDPLAFGFVHTGKAEGFQGGDFHGGVSGREE